ncbi:hypothetical protein KSD_02800 [Ktedonobacter sp. SOSP1-85]|nr:hypothetical protein KSD_02800 [Ktedonobacter sp. SOSP1-85]
MVIALLVAAVALYGLFLVVERKAAEPILLLDVFRQPVFAIDALQTLIQGMILIGAFLPLSLFLQGVLALSPTAAGALITALSVSLTLGAALAGTSISLRKRYQLTAITGAVMMTAGALLLLLMGATSNLPLIGLALILIGLGAGSFFTIQMVVAQNAIPLSHLGVGIGVIRYLGQLGMTLGAALMGLLVNGALAGNTDASLPTSSAARVQLSSVLQNSFGMVLVLSIMLLVTTLFLKDVPRKSQTE